MRVKILLYFSLFFGFGINASYAQYTLAICQVGLINDTIPPLMVTDDQKPFRLNDSTLLFDVPPTRTECLFIILDVESGWFTRVWIDSTKLYKELVINYTMRTASIKDGNETDKLLEKVLQTNNQRVSDSISTAYILSHSSEYFSLWLLSHGLNSGNPKKNLTLLESLSPELKKQPVYRQMKANLTTRNYPKYGDTFKEFRLEDKNNTVFNSTSIKNKIVVLHFWSTTCAPCVQGMDDLVAFYKSLDTANITFVSISLDKERNRWQTSNTTSKIKWPNLWTEDNLYCELCLHYNLMAIPYFVIFDKYKKLTFYNDGEDIALLKSKLREIKD